MSKNNVDEIIKILKEIIPEPKCELNYGNVFELLCAVMLSSQTTDKRVNQITPQLFAKYPNSFLLSQATYEDLYNIIKPLGFAKIKANNLIDLAKSLEVNFAGVVPNNFKDLELLAGVGHKTASVVLALGYNIPAMPVDTHVQRVAKRLSLVDNTANVNEVEEVLKSLIPQNEWIDGHHLFLLFGRHFCKAVKPECANCKLKKFCSVEL